MSVAAYHPAPGHDNLISPFSSDISASGTSSRHQQTPRSGDNPQSAEGSSTRKRRDSSVGEEGGPKQSRVRLACFYCRVKRIRCSGRQPVCEACERAKEKCEWPSGRRRKRTRKEMAEARQAAGINEQAQTAQRDPSVASDVFTTNFGPFDNLDTPTFSNFVWPSGFTPENPAPIAAPPQITFPSPRGPRLSQGFPDIPGGLMDAKIMSALEGQTAVIEGDPEGQDLELFYYRMSGPTALHPGVNRISLKLQRRSAESPYAAAPQPGSDHPSAPSITEIFDPSGMPLPHICAPLFDLFFRHLSQHFPSISRQRMNERFESGTMSQFLANCICALGARLSDEAKTNPTLACAPFIAKAQELIVPLLHLPASDVVTGLLLLAWACFGQNSESGLWQYSGMANRMAIDLGHHEVSDLYESPAHVIRTKLLFWSLFITDRILAFVTGRPASIPEDIIEIPLPEDKDFFPDPARNMVSDMEEMVEPVPFVQLVKLMIICGRISNVLNGRRGRIRTLVSTNEPLAEQLSELQMRLLRFISGLPPSLQWSIDNFRRQNARGHGGVFLNLHLWANAVLALIYHPDLLKSPSGVETPLNQSMSRSIKLALASSRQISECMVFADLVANTSYVSDILLAELMSQISTPFIVQPLYVASMALIYEMRAAQTAEPETNGSNGMGTDIYFFSMARQNLQALLKAVELLEHYWAGVTSVATILERRSGFPRTTPRVLGPTFISLPDKGLLRRFTTGSYWLNDLMAGYTVENMSFAPVDGLDLERLLANSGFNAFMPGPTPMT